MKYRLSLFFMVFTLAFLTACGKKTDSESTAAQITQTEVQTETASPETKEETEEAVPENGSEEASEAESVQEIPEEGAEEAGEDVQHEGRHTVILAAASNLMYILEDQLIPQFEELNPDLHVEAVYDSSERLKARIERGSNFDLFFCASKKPMSQLVEQGLIMEDSVHFLMSNELVLFVPRTSRLGLTSLSDISKAEKIGIGDPADVPVGEYTIETLKEQELWDRVKEKEVYLSSSVDELIQWVVDGTVDCGFAYRNDVIEHLDQVYVVEGLAPTTYRIGILSSTGRLEYATAFADFLGTDAVLAQFVAHGFTLP